MSFKKTPVATNVPAVLVVESNKFQRRTLCRLMRAAGADRVAEAPDMSAAQRVVSMRRWPHWILVVDPDALGADAMAVVERFAEASSVVAVLLLTSRRPPAADQWRDQAQQQGIPLLAALRKPVSAEEIGTLLRRWVEHPASALTAAAPVLTTEELGECLRDGRMYARFQPELELESGRPVSCEAVPYLTHARYGDVPAARFSHAVMQLGAQRVLTASVLRDAAEMVRSLREKGLLSKVSVNVAPDVLSDPGDAASLDSYVRTLGIASSDLTLEISTSRHALSFPSFSDNLARLKLRGYSLAIDDGPNVLQLDDPVHAHFSQLKVSWAEFSRQRSDPAASRSIAATLQAARKHGIVTCAVDVDAGADLDQVRRAGFEFAQGELFTPPLPADETLLWVEREEHTRSFAQRSGNRHLAS